MRACSDLNSRLGSSCCLGTSAPRFDLDRALCGHAGSAKLASDIKDEGSTVSDRRKMRNE